MIRDLIKFLNAFSSEEPPIEWIIEKLSEEDKIDDLLTFIEMFSEHIEDVADEYEDDEYGPIDEYDVEDEDCDEDEDEIWK